MRRARREIYLFLCLFLGAFSLLFPIFCYTYFCPQGTNYKRGEAPRKMKNEENKMKRKPSFKARLRGTFLIFLSATLLLSPLTAHGATKAAEGDLRVSSRILDLFREKPKTQEKTLYLCPGGQAFGMKIHQSGVTVTTVTDEKSPLGKLLCAGDVLLALNGEAIEGATDFCQKFNAAKGSISLTLLRGKEKKTVLIPHESKCEGHGLGIELKDTAAGIGTVTYIDPETGAFGGLGHGICAPDTGEIYPMQSGIATEVILGGVLKSAVGKPGELRGVLGRREIGTLYKNTDCGVFGVFSLEGKNLSEPLPVGTREELTLGEAEILSSLKNGAPQRYKIRITEIDRSATDSKSFRIEVTDQALIALTGGIVRGMSGSPIIQNGKLVGAVTHVLVANPTEGYGIFIENMLNAAQNQVIPKAA